QHATPLGRLRMQDLVMARLPPHHARNGPWRHVAQRMQAARTSPDHPAQEHSPMAKLRHIAISVSDPEKAARFFEQAFGMTRAGRAQRGVYMTDGVMNVALLHFADEPVPGFEDQGDYQGLIHFGMWVDNVEETDAKVKAAGGSYMTGRHETNPNVFYE